jgi:nicotinamide-nucleotide amidase
LAGLDLSGSLPEGLPMDFDDPALAILARRVGAAVAEGGGRLATAESCTGGWIAKLLTDIPGSSAWFEGGCVTYSNAAKGALLGVAPEILAAHGAVSRDVVQAMAAGARRRFGTTLAVAVSGVAGPGGGTPDKPVGTVWLAWAGPGNTLCSEVRHLPGDRDAVRRQAVGWALAGVLEAAGRA